MAEDLIGIVLAAGRGTRLQPLTQAWAKAVIPVLNRPLVFRSLDRLVAAGIRRIAVNAHHLADQVIHAVMRWGRAEGVGVLVSFEPRLLGTGGGIRRAWERMGATRGPIVVVNADVVSDVALAPHIAAHRASGWEASLVVSRAGEGRVFVEPDTGRVVGLPGQDGPVRVGAGAERSFTGISILDGAAVRRLPEGPSCLLRQGLSRRLRAGRVGALESHGLHLDVGTPERFLEVSFRMLRAAPGAAPRVPQGSVLNPPVLLASDTDIEGPVVLGPDLIVGGGSRIAAGTHARRGVAWAATLTGDLANDQGGWIQLGSRRITIPHGAS